MALNSTGAKVITIAFLAPKRYYKSFCFVRRMRNVLHILFLTEILDLFNGIKMLQILRLSVVTSNSAIEILYRQFVI